MPTSHYLPPTFSFDLLLLILLFSFLVSFLSLMFSFQYHPLFSSQIRVELLALMAE